MKPRLIFTFIVFIVTQTHINAQILCREVPSNNKYIIATGFATHQNERLAELRAHENARQGLISEIIKYYNTDINVAGLVDNWFQSCNRWRYRSGKYTHSITIRIERETIETGLTRLGYNFNGGNNHSSSPDNDDKQIPPILSLSDIKFFDTKENNIIDALEQCLLSFTLTNSGRGAARNFEVKLQNQSDVLGLEFNETTRIGTIEPNTEKIIRIPINSNINLSTGKAKFLVSFTEEMGLEPDPFEISIETRAFDQPEIQVVDYAITTETGMIRTGQPITINALIQNIGRGKGENVQAKFVYPTTNVFPNSYESIDIGSLSSGESKEISFEFIASRLYSEKTIPITILVTEKHGSFSKNRQIIATLDAEASITSISIQGIETERPDDLPLGDITIASLSSNVDRNIPVNAEKHPNRYALVIGNEDYSSRHRGLSSESDVAFAVNDARIFKEYCVKTLGVKEQNVFYLINATAAEMHNKIELVSEILGRLDGQGELIFYYAGHGHPDENTREPYLIPVDVNASRLSSAIKLHDVYKTLAQTNAKRITVFLDACFTGGGRESGLLAARLVRVSPREEPISGNMVVFAATSDDQTALPYTMQQHGMFTYFLLKKLQETSGDVSYGDLDDYLRRNVSIESLRVNHRPQDPNTLISRQVANAWRLWLLK